MDIRELEDFKLSDAVKFHDELNPALWEDDKLRPEVRKQLMTIAHDFISELGISGLKVKDVTVSGSNAAYTYTPYSDLDLHILVDFNELSNDEVYQELFTAKKSLYNDSHDIKVHGVPVELYVQDSNQPVVSIGEYSLKNNEWLRYPSKRKANFNQTATKAKYEKLGSMIELALQSNNLEQIDKVLKIIKQYRKAGLDTTGEFGPENLAFKALRNMGLIKKLYDNKAKLHSRELSIDEVLDTQPTKQHKAKWDFSSPDLEDLKFTASNGINYSLNFMDPYIGPTEINDFDLLPKNLPDSYYDRGKFVEFAQLSKRGKEKQGVEGTGAAAEVFGIVTNGILSYIKKKKPTYLYFQAAEPNRQSLYSKMIKKILPLLPNWKLNGPTNDGVFMLYSMPKGMKDVEEDWHPNDTPPGPEFKPTMPKGTVRVDISDVYDWYKLGQHISNMKGLGKHDFGKGPPSTILSFGDEDLEHQYIDALKKTGLDTTDIDPKAHDTKKGQKVDPTYNVNEEVQHYMYGHCHVMALALKQLHPDWQIRAHIGWDEEDEDDDEYEDEHRVDHIYIVAPDGSAYDCRGKFNNEQELVGPDETGGAETQFVDYSIADIKNDVRRGELKPFTKQDIQKAIEFSKQIVAEASGYIPSEKEKNDPRFSTALTVDVRPDSIRKNARAFGFKVSRAGKPPLLRK